MKPILEYFSEALKYNDKSDLYIVVSMSDKCCDMCEHSLVQVSVYVCMCVCIHTNEKKRLRQIKRSHAINLNIKLV